MLWNKLVPPEFWSTSKRRHNENCVCTCLRIEGRVKFTAPGSRLTRLPRTEFHTMWFFRDYIMPLITSLRGFYRIDRAVNALLDQPYHVMYRPHNDAPRRVSPPPIHPRKSVNLLTWRRPLIRTWNVVNFVYTLKLNRQRQKIRKGNRAFLYYIFIYIYKVLFKFVYKILITRL